MVLAVPLEVGRVACADSVEGFLRAVDGLSEYELLAASRCHGWSRLDVLVHVLAGWQEMLAGLVCAVDSEPTVDAASYWTAFASQYADEEPVTVLMAQRRRAAAYARPSSATAHLHDVADAILTGVAACTDAHRRWQGQVFTAGDFLAVWAVEDVVHHLDLLADEPAPPRALAVARATVEALVGEPLPSQWTDLEATLVGCGRVPVPPDGAHLAARLPALG